VILHFAHSHRTSSPLLALPPLRLAPE
jgi:hypothetical protein